MIAPRLVALAGAAAAMTALLSGCPSAYQRTYDQRMQQLESQQQAETAQQKALHAQAQKYAAVIYFPVGSAVIDKDGEREISWFVTQMQPYPQAMIQVQGFADSTGSEANNQGLSDQRAAAVSSALEAQGIAAARIVTQGFGQAYPAQTNDTTEGRRNNRRVEVTVR